MVSKKPQAVQDDAAMAGNSPPSARKGETVSRPRTTIAGAPSMPTPSDHDDEDLPDRRTAALIGLVVILVLAILAILLVQKLGTQSKVEDCLMSGRTNCAPIEAPARQ